MTNSRPVKWAVRKCVSYRVGVNSQAMRKLDGHARTLVVRQSDNVPYLPLTAKRHFAPDTRGNVLFLLIFCELLFPQESRRCGDIS